eukprot:1161312-Pelagomonas_calceolata.AAC.7
MQALKTLRTSIKEKRTPRTETPCIPFTKGKKKEVNGDREGKRCTKCTICINELLYGYTFFTYPRRSGLRQRTRVRHLLCPRNGSLARTGGSPSEQSCHESAVSRQPVLTGMSSFTLDRPTWQA